MYSGSARWTRACEAAKLLTCLSHGVDIRSGDQWDLTTEGARRLLWAVIVVCVPKWVHSEFPCTIWASLAHTNRKSATIGDDEESRTCALVHVILTCQLAQGQSKKGYQGVLREPALSSLVEIGYRPGYNGGHWCQRVQDCLMRVGPRRPREREASEERAVCGIHRRPIKFGEAMHLLFGSG